MNVASRGGPSRDALSSVTDCRYLTTENPELAFDDRAPGGTWFPDVDPVNLSFEVLDGLVSYEWPWCRVYGGDGFLAGAKPDLDATILTGGVEFRSPNRRGALGLTPVVGLDINSLEARDWDLTASLMGGIEMSNLEGTRRYRVMLSFLRGFIPFGQFFSSQRLTGWGLTLQFDF